MNADRKEISPANEEELRQEIARLNGELDEARETLDAIRKGEVDALVFSGEDGEQVFTICGEQEPYRIFVETMYEGAVMVAADGTIVYSNLRFAEMLETPLEDVIGSAFVQFVAPSDGSVFDELQKGGELQGARLECELISARGAPVPVLLSVRSMHVGDVRSLCIIATDLTDRKLAEDKLLASKLRLRLIFDQLPAAVWTTDRDLRILSVSGATLAQSGLPAEASAGMPVQQFLGDPDGVSTAAIAHVAALNGEARSYEHNFDGTIFSVSVNPLHDADGQIAGVIGVALDVTENKRALASVAKLAAIVEASQDAIYGMTPSGYITSWNHGAEKMYGYTAAEVIGQHISIIVLEGKRQKLADMLEELKRGQVIKSFETVRRCKDGSLVDVSLTVSAVKDAGGRMIGVSAIAHDLRDRKKVERELRALSARLLKVQDEERRNMARDLHDSVIQGLAAGVLNLSILKDSTQLLPEARKTVEETLKITEDAVREIRTFSYLLHPPLLDVMGLQSALRWYVEGYSKRSNIQVELDLPEGQERLAKEIELALFRIVQEALTNIHRHSGGHQAAIHLRRAENEVALVISDDGHGMDAQTLEKVRQEGSVLGVGIAGMKQRLQQLGGRLDISSSSSGTAVTASVPVNPEEK